MAADIILAAITGAHGIRGEVRLKLFTEMDSLAALRRFVVGGHSLTLAGIRPDKAGAVARFAEITDRNAAEALRGQVLSVPRDALPPLAEGEYYHADYVGRPVALADGTPIGSVRAIENFGASDILDIDLAEGGSVMVPFIADAVTEADGRLLIDPVWLA